MGQPRLRLDRLTKAYDQTPVVQDLSLSVDEGEFCVILGPSGSGKTTVVNMIGGFTAPTAGEIFVDEVPCTGQPPYKRHVGVVFQNYALFPHLSVLENVGFPLRARGIRGSEFEDRVNRILGLVELDRLADRLPRELSGGQQQRTALARALVFDPRVLLMDEPLAALDRRLRERMQSEIKSIQRALGITVLYITHDQQEAMLLADKLVVMNQGRIEQQGAPLNVYHRPRTRFVTEFLGDSNVLDAVVTAVGDGTGVARVGPEALVEFDLGEDVIGPSDQVSLAVRPEKISFLAPGDHTDNRVGASIVESVDVGVTRRYRAVLVDTNISMLVLEQGLSSRPFRRPGEQVVLGWERGDTVTVALERPTAQSELMKAGGRDPQRAPGP
jgi:putative spermidine/putrescine transport system ATP-binding protein